ncbi:MAG: PHB depolymerase family esterase [Gemmatimonadota bacterium]|nr:PHB depolymerase family esterase [Gemmatimonadota bacterium]
MRSRYPQSLAMLTVLLAALVTSAAAQAPVSATTARIQELSYQFEGAPWSSVVYENVAVEMEYQMYVPTTYDGSTAYPLMVLLHGLGSNPGGVIRYQGLTDLAEERGYIVAAPMGYNSRGWYGSRGTGRASNRGDDANDPANLGDLSELDVMNVLAMTLEGYNIDRARIYLAGHSMGGGGTWHLGIKYPDIWAGLGPVAPAIYTSPDALSAITHIPVIIIQGDEDRLVNVDIARRWVAQMQELGMTHQDVEIPGGDHSRIIARDPDNVKAIFDFFDQQRKN